VWYTEGVRGRDVKPGQSTPDADRGASRAQAAAASYGVSVAVDAGRERARRATVRRWRPAGSAFPALGSRDATPGRLNGHSDHKST